MYSFSVIVRHYVPSTTSSLQSGKQAFRPSVRRCAEERQGLLPVIAREREARPRQSIVLILLAMQLSIFPVLIASLSRGKLAMTEGVQNES